LGFCLFTGGRRRPAKKNKKKGERRDFVGEKAAVLGFFLLPRFCVGRRLRLS